MSGPAPRSGRSSWNRWPQPPARSTCARAEAANRDEAATAMKSEGIWRMDTLGYFASGSGRSWNLMTALRVPRPPSMCQVAFGP